MKKLDKEHKELIEKNLDTLTSIAVNKVYVTPSFQALSELASAYTFIGYPQPSIRCSNCVMGFCTQLYAAYMQQLEDEKKEEQPKIKNTKKNNLVKKGE